MRAFSKFLMLILLLLVATYLSGCFGSSTEGEHEDEEITEEMERVPDQILYQSDILFSEEGVKQLLIKSEYLEKYTEDDSTILVDINAIFYDSLGQQESVLDADSGLVREQTDWLKVWGDVDVVSDNGVRLQADSLFWDQRRNMITTESFVTISREGNVQTGYGLESNSSLTEFQIKKRVRGRFENIEKVQPRKPSEGDSTNPR